jgi:hypothetical protein
VGYPITQNQTARALLFKLYLSSDHITGATGKTPTVTLSKNGGAFAAAAGAITEVANGIYKVAANATDANTLGPLRLFATAAGCDQVDECFEVVAYNPDVSANLGLGSLPTPAPGAAGGLPVCDASGNVAANVAAINDAPVIGSGTSGSPWGPA